MGTLEIMIVLFILVGITMFKILRLKSQEKRSFKVECDIQGVGEREIV